MLPLISKEELWDVLDDLREATVGVNKARLEDDRDKELACIKNVQATLYDVLKAYHNSNEQVPKMLTEFQLVIEKRRAMLDPQGPYL